MSNKSENGGALAQAGRGGGSGQGPDAGESGNNMQEQTARQLVIEGRPVRFVQSTAGNGYRFKAILPTDSPPEVGLHLFSAAKDWCAGLTNAHPNLTARTWREGSNVLIEALAVNGDSTGVIGEYVDSLIDVLEQSGRPASAGTGGGMPARGVPA